GRDGPAQKLTLVRDGVESRGRAKVDHDARPPVPLKRRQCIYDPIRTHLAGILREDRQAGAGSGLHDHGRKAEVSLGHLPEGWGGRGEDRGGGGGGGWG